MPKQEGQKTKLLALLHIFEQKTDENHLLNVPQLVELLEQQGILAERKSIYSDIDTLCALGYDIQLRRGRGGGYWMASRAFELSELKLLVDAVQASKVISARTSKKLIRKLEALCSEYEGTQLQRQVYVDGRPKADSRTLLYSIDALHTAISAGRLVQFRYKNNSTWTVSPWQLAWEGGCYYLIAYQDEKDPANIRNYRVDRMSYVKVLDRPRRGKEAFAAFDLPSYLRKHFNMFGGPEYRVTLRCTADLEAAMRDRFGQDTLFLPEADGYFHFDVPVCVSDQFYGWVCGFGGKVEITSPAEVRQGLHDMVQELAEQMQKQKEQGQTEQFQQQIAEELRQIQKLDPTVKEIGDILQMETGTEFTRYVKEKGLSFLEAFKLANADQIAQRRADRQAQRALQAVTSKSHLVPTRGSAEDSMAVPHDVAEMYRAMDPSLSAQDIQREYNKWYKQSRP